MNRYLRVPATLRALLAAPLLASLSAAAILPGSTAVRAQEPATRLVILGTGTPIADPDRFGPSVAVVVGEESYLVDAGAGVVRRAAAAARNGIAALAPSNLKRVFITHLHSDHTVGLPDLMFTPWQNGRNMPVEVYGPPGTLRMTTNIEEAWVEDVHMRLFGLEGRTAHNYRALPREIEAGTVYDDGTVRVAAIPVQHTSWPVSFGYSFVTPDRTIVISGDARPRPSLVEACNGCDVLVHEVYSRDLLRPAPQPDLPRGGAHLDRRGGRAGDGGPSRAAGALPPALPLRHRRGPHPGGARGGVHRARGVGGGPGRVLSVAHGRSPADGTGLA